MEKIEELLKHADPKQVEGYLEKEMQPYHDECMKIGNTIKEMIDKGVIKDIRMNKDGVIEVVQ